MENCKICGSNKFDVLYEGPIRTGRFGNISQTQYSIKRCLSCSVIFLPNIIEDHNLYYESQSYREEVDGIISDVEYFLLHDGEQTRHLGITGTSIFRNKIVTDIGCGAGSFLDIIKGYAKETIGVEPSTIYRNSLQKRGYLSYPYVQDALVEKENRVEVAVSFSVLEHVEDPLTFLKEIYKLLSPGGKLILSTPNADDILLSALPEVYPQFFYRKAHLWYFNQNSLLKILKFSGFSGIKIIPHHRFGLSNFVLWLRNKSPSGNMRLEYITETLENIWKSELERTSRCDYLYAIADKNGLDS